MHHLARVLIPATVTNIGPAFGACIQSDEHPVAVDNPVYSSVNGVVCDKAKTTLILAPEGLDGGYAIPGGVINIGDWAFYNCTNLTNVTMAASVTNRWRTCVPQLHQPCRCDDSRGGDTHRQSAFYECRRFDQNDDPRKRDQSGQLCLQSLHQSHTSVMIGSSDEHEHR